LFKIDLHVHTVLGGDADIDPTTVVYQARKQGLDAICITEHHDYKLSHPFEAIARKEQFPIFRGLEYRAAEGHLLIYGVHAGKGDFLPGLPMQTILDWVNNRGGVAIPAHPYQGGLNRSKLGDGIFRLKGLVALETINGSLNEEENLRARAAAEKMGLSGTGGSDAHGIHVLGSAYTCFPAPITCEADLVAALRKGDYFPRRHPGPHS